MHVSVFALVGALTLSCGSVIVGEESPGVVKSAELGGTPNVHVVGRFWLAGQPSAEDLSEAAKQGVQRVVNIRTAREMRFDEAAAAKQCGLSYEAIPVGAPNSLNDKTLERIRATLRKAAKDKAGVLLHCGSATRVAAVWLAYRVLDEKQSLETALQEANEVGLRGGYEERVLQYIREQQSGSK